MPHKRAKRPVREREKAQRAADLAPKISIEHEPIPESASRVLNAEKIRREYRKKKRRLDGVGDSNGDNCQGKKQRRGATGMKDDGGQGTALGIKHGETSSQFNRRVENSMIPLIKTAVRQSSALMRRVWRAEAAHGTPKRGKQGSKAHRPLLGGPERGLDPPPTVAAGEEIVNPRSTREDFRVVPTSTPRRLNDVAQEPPLLKRLPRGATIRDAVPSGVLSMGQKAMMDEERDKAIKHYRELKARRLREGGSVKLDGRLDGSRDKLP